MVNHEKLEAMLAKLTISNFNPHILEAMRKIPREYFVPEKNKDNAYKDQPIMIFDDEHSISQPYTVALMLQWLQIKKGNSILEIGAGTGWNACLLAELTKTGEVVSIDNDERMVKFAKNNQMRLESYGVSHPNLTIEHKDGAEIYQEGRTFDRIIITAAVPRLFPYLKEQLNTQGILIAPFDNKDHQLMKRYTKNTDTFEHYKNLVFNFVPFKCDPLLQD